MFKKLISTVVMAGVLLSGASIFAMTKADKNGKQVISVTNVRVTAIKGNVITIKDDKGIERVLELKSVEGIKIGTSGTCEEDCGRTLKIGEKNITIQKVIK
jgi:hypothetical protein